MLHFLLAAASATNWQPLLVFVVAPAQSHYSAAYCSHFNLGHCNQISQVLSPYCFIALFLTFLPLRSPPFVVIRVPPPIILSSFLFLTSLPEPSVPFVVISVP